MEIVRGFLEHKFQGWPRQLNLIYSEYITYNNKMELQSIKISTIRNDVWVYLDVLDIAEPVSAAPHVRLKAGVWLLANTMRWFRNASETLVRLIPRLRLGHDQVVLSAKASLLKAPPSV